MEFIRKQMQSEHGLGDSKIGDNFSRRLLFHSSGEGTSYFNDSASIYQGTKPTAGSYAQNAEERRCSFLNDSTQEAVSKPRQKINRSEGTEARSILNDWENCKWDEIIKFVTDCPHEASLPLSDRNNKTTTILHKVLSSKDIDSVSRLTLVKIFLQKAPHLARIKNHHGSLPLHVAARNIGKLCGPNVNNSCIIDELVAAFPGALTIGDAMGSTPLHVACEKWCSSKIAALLVHSAPESTSIKDKKGCLPIHIACRRRCSSKKVRLLLEASPDSIHAKTNDGETPLTIAVSTSSAKHPQCALIRDLKIALDHSRSRGNKKRERDNADLSTKESIAEKAKMFRMKRARMSDASQVYDQPSFLEEDHDGYPFENEGNPFQSDDMVGLSHPQSISLKYPEMLMPNYSMLPLSQRVPLSSQFQSLPNSTAFDAHLWRRRFHDTEDSRSFFPGGRNL